MKVYIGPYKSWIGPYQIAGLLKWVGVSEDTTYEIGKWLDEKTPLGKICMWLHNKRERTYKIKLHPYDTWNMDTNLAPLIAALLKQLKKTTHGAPMSIWNESMKEDEIFQKWDEILDKMIWSFEEVSKDWEDQFHSNETGFDVEGFHKHNARIKEGLELFGKHYMDLWD